MSQSHKTSDLSSDHRQYFLLICDINRNSDGAFPIEGDIDAYAEVTQAIRDKTPAEVLDAVDNGCFVDTDLNSWQALCYVAGKRDPSLKTIVGISK